MILSRRSSVWPRMVTALLVVGGLALFATVLWSIDTSAVTQQLNAIGWRISLVVLPYLLVAVSDTVGWWFAFPAAGCPVPFITLFKLRLGAKAVYDLTPAYSLAGELAKIHLLRHRGVESTMAVASVISAKITVSVAEFVFVLTGFAAAAVMLPATRPVLSGAWAGLLLIAAALTGTILWQRHGFFRPFIGLARRASGVFRVVMRYQESLQRIDDLLVDYMCRQSRRFWGSCLGHFLGWAAGALEVWLLLALLQKPVDLTTAFIIETLLLIVQSLTGFLPGNIGTLEAGAMATFLWLGLPAADAVAFILLRRLRQLAWTAAGLAVLAQSASSVAPAFLSGQRSHSES